MTNPGKKKVPSKGELKALLEQVLVPVQPSPQFLNRLKGRLIHYQGDGMPSPWILVSMVAMLLILLVASLGVALRLILGFASLIGIVRRRRLAKAEVPASIV